MIFGIGTDIVSVPRIRAGLERHGERFARRILADAEFEQFVRSGSREGFLAKRFAAKEATAKAFGTGFRDGLSLRDIVVENSAEGAPRLRFHRRGAELVQRLGIGESFISLADEREMAVAFVTLLKGAAHG